jgi:hypothetical protein
MVINRSRVGDAEYDHAADMRASACRASLFSLSLNVKPHQKSLNLGFEITVFF